jgi:hypothetical protein
MIEIRKLLLFTAIPIALFALASLAGPPAKAQDVFAVNGLEVDETAADDVTAKYNGIVGAQQVALGRVLRRLVMPDDYGRLPDVDEDTLALMVSDYDVADEKFGGGRYLAIVSVRFIPEEIEFLLRGAGIPFAMTQSQPMVVLAVLETGNSSRLWADPNAWRAAWANRPAGAGLFSLIVPIGDLVDVSTIGVDGALAEIPQAHEAIAVRYQAAGTLVALAKVAKNSANAWMAEISLSFVGGGLDGTGMEYSYVSGPGSGLPAFLALVVEELTGVLELDWREDNLLDFRREERISVLVPIQDFGQWLAIRERLGAMARVQEIGVARLTRDEAEVDLVYIGNTNQLRDALGQQGLELVYSPDHPLWLLRLSGGR